VLVSQYYSLAYGNPADVQSEDRRRIGRSWYCRSYAARQV